MALLYTWVKGATFLGMAERFPPLINVVMRLLPKHLRESEITHRKLTIDMLDRRMKATDPRPDL